MYYSSCAILSSSGHSPPNHAAHQNKPKQHNPQTLLLIFSKNENGKQKNKNSCNKIIFLPTLIGQTVEWNWQYELVSKTQLNIWLLFQREGPRLLVRGLLRIWLSCSLRTQWRQTSEQSTSNTLTNVYNIYCSDVTRCRSKTTPLGHRNHTWVEEA